MIESKDLELTSSLTIGTLETNADIIKARVEEELKNYKPEFFADEKEAKEARSTLNTAAKALNAKRLELERTWNKPFELFKSKMTATCNLIKDASSKLDEIVKTKEQEEKDAKLKEIQKYFDDQSFTLCTLEQIMEKSWLNKTTKLSQVKQAINAKIHQIIEDLEIIENFGANAGLIKSVYLKNFSLSEATAEAKRLEENAKRLEEEKINRRQNIINVQVRTQKAEEMEELNTQKAHDLSSEAAALQGFNIKQKEPEPLETYALKLTGTRKDLIAIRQKMSEFHISYIKLVDKKDGSFIIE